MSFYFPNVDPIFIKQRSGTEDDPFLFLIDTNHVRNSAVMLKEIPSFKEKVVLKTSEGTVLNEVDSDDPTVDQFRVDYSVGSVHVHSSREGQELTAEYWGMGYVNISAERVIVYGSQEDPLQTLQDALESVAEGVSTLEQVGDLDFKDEYSDSHAYRKWNFVTYEGSTYVSIKNGTGNSPHDQEYWRLVSSGVGFIGIYDTDITYYIGDIVSDVNKKNLYVSRVSNNNFPLTDSNAWHLMITLDDMVNQATTAINEAIEQLQALESSLVASDAQRDANDVQRDQRVDVAVEELESFMGFTQDGEDERVLDEIARKSSESERVTNEGLREAREATRQQQENQRVSNETAREQNFTAKTNEIDNSLSQFDGKMSSVDDALIEMGIISDTVEGASIDVNIALDELEGFGEVDGEEFDIETEYKKFNTVSHDGSSYIAIQDTVGNDVEDKTFWKLLARRGVDGNTISVEEIFPDENNNISLEPLGLTTTQEFADFEEHIVADFDNKIGFLSELKTARKSSIVESINELKSRIDDIIEIIS